MVEGDTAVRPVLLLAVCDDNLFLSPMMERLLQHRLGTGGLRSSVSSAGVHAMDGEPMGPSAQAVASQMGVDMGGFRSRRLTDQHVADTDLILTATRKQRSALLYRFPECLRHAFTLLELAKLMPVAEGARLPEIVASAARNRGSAQVTYGTGAELDLVGEDRAVAEQIQAAVDRIAGRLVDPSGPSGPSHHG